MDEENFGQGFFPPRVRIGESAAGVDDVEDWA
jgi:hypothetical protein